MAKAKDSNSESETRNPPRVHKSRHAVAAQMQAQQEYLSKHINSNGPKDKPKIDPLDFDTLPIQSLNNYSRFYNLNQHAVSVHADILYSEIGKKTSSYKKNLSKVSKIDKVELSSNVKKHFTNLPVKENEILTNFLYKVKNDNKAFKLNFK
ncbi:transcriptional regulatory protein Sap30p [[Candida] jaroonii]|uniref:Transcriptional regulatory protein Sap30p n=1 Tax=[Candida] jaroonii TaxID=467808 RepID=A0ACA9Y792_9ASCO|nr:transcriptional regulatory protein Sap30p [[Candida] jaroonii]